MSRCGVEMGCSLEWEEMENKFQSDGSVEKIEEIQKKLLDWKNKHKPHPAIKYGGINGMFSFLFYTRRFNPPDVEKCKGVPDCYMCGYKQGDCPSHLVKCQHELVKKVLNSTSVKIGYGENLISTLLEFGNEWRVLKKRNGDGDISVSDCVILTKAHSDLYHIRRKFRDETLKLI